MSTSYSEPRVRFCSLASLVVAMALLGCDADRCVRNSDCQTGYICSEGYCALKPVAMDAAGVDGALPEAGAADGSTTPDGATGDAGASDAAAHADAGTGTMEDAGTATGTDAGSVDDAGMEATDGGADAGTDSGA